MKRNLTYVLAFLLGGLLFPRDQAASPKQPAAAGVWSNRDLVQTRFGLVRGAKDKEETWVWKGVPYARPPVGDLRWRAPRDPDPWSGVRPAKAFGNAAAQFFPILGFITGSEDCLYLNVWRPRNTQMKLPVYVWIHGGGNSIGSAHMVPDYYGHAKASRSQLVFVSINYRLGPFGWFLHPALRTNASPEDASGNYGTLDILQALKWIQGSIEAFGGDPDRVTLAGESAGAMNILSLLTSPLAKGLFHGVVLQSGTTRMATPEAGLLSSEKLLKALLIHDGKARDLAGAERVAAATAADETARFLRGRKASTILSRLKGGPTGMTGAPSIFSDGWVIPSNGYEVLTNGDYPVKVPVLIGANKEELKLFLFFDRKLDWKGEVFRAVAKYGSRRWMAEGADGVAGNLARHEGQPPVYVYRFDWGSVNAKGASPMPGDYGERLGAFHSMEIPFFLGTDSINGIFLTGRLFSPKNLAGRKALSADLMAYLAAFARTGDPNAPLPGGGSRPKWEPKTKAPSVAKGLVFDVDGDVPAITPLTEVLTLEGLDAEMKAELKEPLHGEVARRLKRN